MSVRGGGGKGIVLILFFCIVLSFENSLMFYMFKDKIKKFGRKNFFKFNIDGNKWINCILMSNINF